MEKRAVEQTGLVPRSILRTFERFRQQLFPGAEFLVLQEFRISRYQVIVSVKCLLILVLTPLLVNFLTKWFFLDPITEYFWNTKQHEIFLNTYQQNRALLDMKNFEEKIFFESFLENSKKINQFEDLEELSSHNSVSEAFVPQHFIPFRGPALASTTKEPSESFSNSKTKLHSFDNFLIDFPLNNKTFKYRESSVQLKTIEVQGKKNHKFLSEDLEECEAPCDHVSNIINLVKKQSNFAQNVLKSDFINQKLVVPELSDQNFSDLPRTGEVENFVKQKFQQKTLQLAIQYNQETIEALSNLFADFFTFLSLIFLFWLMKPQIIILKSFLTESIYSLSDTTKSFLLILFTDLLVGFHSPRGWEFFLELLLRHFGLPENQDFIFLFVATFPVLLDTVFKYWIFRSLNKISPSTVATYHTMIE